jgi:hypothetical protein
MRFPSFEDLAQVVRDSARLKRDERIDPDSQFLRDLGITGKHWIELLKAVEGHYGIEFKPELYERLQTEELARSEDSDESPLIQSLFGSSAFTGHSFTVGQLYKAVLPALQQHPRG